MKVLSGILDKRGRRESGGFRRPALSRLWVLGAAMIVFASFTMIYTLVQNTDTSAGAHETDVASDEYGDFEPAPSAQVAAPQINPLTAPAAASTAAAIDTPQQPQQPAKVQAAVYRTTEALKAKTAWLDGTIIPDDNPSP